MFRLVADIHLSDIGSLDCQQPPPRAPYWILIISIQRVSTVLVLAYLVFKVSHGSSRSLRNYWPPWWAKYNASMVKHSFQINRYCKLQNMQKRIIGCWKRDFDNILLTNCNNRSLIWIYRWTCRATCWHPAQLRRVENIQSNRTWVDGSGLWTIRTATLATVWFGPWPEPEVTVLNRC